MSRLFTTGYDKNDVDMEKMEKLRKATYISDMVRLNTVGLQHSCRFSLLYSWYSVHMMPHIFSVMRINFILVISFNIRITD